MKSNREGQPALGKDGANNAHFVPFLDGVRGVAVLLVILYHSRYEALRVYEIGWNGWLRDISFSWQSLILLPATIGSTGVAIFFVVSGFCVHVSWAASAQKHWGAFFLRRFFRIYPPYFLALVIFVTLVPVSRLDWSHFKHAIAQFGSHALLVHNFVPGAFYSITGSFWSIAIEFQLYLMYPLLCLLVRSLGWSRALAITACIELGINGLEAFRMLTGEAEPSFWFSTPLRYWLSWSVGAYLADLYLEKKKMPWAGISLAWFLTGFALCYLIRPLAPFSFLLAALCTAKAVALLISRDAPPADSRGRWSGLGRLLKKTGIISYSLYLLHEPILKSVPSILARALPGVVVPSSQVLAGCLVMIIPIWGGAWLFHRYAELPSIGMGKAIVRRIYGAPRRTPAS